MPDDPSNREPALKPVFQNPYRRWWSGLAFELAAFIGYIALLAAVGLLMAWVR